MAKEKRFGVGLLGYNKKDVYDFIDKLAKDFEEQIRKKDEELNNLKNQNKYLIGQTEELNNKIKLVESDRTYIADAIIKAEEKAKSIVEEAICEAEDKKMELMAAIDNERINLDNVRVDLKKLMTDAVSAIRNYESQLADLAERQEEQEKVIFSIYEDSTQAENVAITAEEETTVTYEEGEE